MGADLRAALVASCLRGALPPVDLRAVCLVRAMIDVCYNYNTVVGVGSGSGNRDQETNSYSLSFFAYG